MTTNETATINATTTTNAALKIRFVEIDAATGEAGVYFDGIQDALIAANINALGVELLAESCRRQKPLEIGDIGERFAVSDAERSIKALRGHYGPQGFDFVAYFASTNFWGADPELCEIFEEIFHKETPVWSQWETGRLGYIGLDREKATLVSIAPRRIARDELRATTTAARVAPHAFLSSLLRDLTAFGPEATWLEDSARPEWGHLEGNPLKPGKLLRKIIPGMTEPWYIAKSEELASRIRQRFSLCEQIRISHDLESIYDMGGRFVSCMKEKGHLYRGILNAVPEVKIAYLTDPGSGRLLGRALLWSDVHLVNDSSIKLMDRIYAEDERIRQSFRKWAQIHGYYYKCEDGHSCTRCTDGQKEVSLSAAYINAAYEFRPGIWRDGAPYLDTFSEIEISDNRIFCFANRGQVSCRETDGTAGWVTNPPVCNACGQEIKESNPETWGNYIYCPTCAEQLEECIHCGGYSHPKQGGAWTQKGYLCADCEHHTEECACCNSLCYDAEMVQVETPEITGEICPDCLQKLQQQHDLQECTEPSCRTLILPDSPGGMCNHHAQTLGHVCANCAEWTRTESAAQFGDLWLCPDCVKLLLQNTPLFVGYYCNYCKTFRPGKPAAVCGHIILCPDCLALEQAPDDYRPPRVVVTPPPAETPENRLADALRVWCQQAKDAARPGEKCHIFAQLNGRILTDCAGSRERHQKVFRLLCDILKSLFSQSVYLCQSPYSSTILWTQFTTPDWSIKIDLTYNQGRGQTWIVARPM